VSDLVKDNLCSNDPRSAFYIELDDDPRPARVNCFCENCFSGKDKLAVRIAELEAENNELQAWVDGYREHGTRVLNANKEEIDTLKAKLDAIANYPDPDFPMEDTEEELKRAWQIIYRLKGMAALQQEGE